MNNKFAEFENMYNQYLIEKVTGGNKISVSELRELAVSAGIIKSSSLSDQEFLDEMKVFQKKMLSLS